MDLSGSWENSYGSLMTLSVAADGSIIGTYSSTTGSSGTYHIIGHTLPSEPKANYGLSVVLSIYWHPIGEETKDESWHWVSTYCGQLLNNGDLVVINSLVATSSFSGFSPGSYIDQLTFTKVDKKLSERTLVVNSIEACNVVANPINGRWIDQDDSFNLTLQVADHNSGLVKGTVQYGQNKTELIGFTDTHLDSLDRQSVSVCGYFEKTNTPVSLSGWLSILDNTLVLSQWNANSTTVENRYYQSSLVSYSLGKA
jgi:hypothetical protein